MDITCPNCQFSRQVPDDKIPGRSVNATCPQCGNKFRFRTPDEQAEPSASVPVPEQQESPSVEALPTEEAVQAQPSPAPEGIATSKASPLQENNEVVHAAGHPVEPQASEDSPEQRPDTETAPPTKQQDKTSGDTGGPSDIWQKLDDLGKTHPGRTPENGSYRIQGAPEESETVPVPFEDLERFGFFGGLWETVRRTLFNPGLFFEAMPLNTSLARPLVFYVLLGELAYMFMAIWESAGLDPFAYFAGPGQEAAAASDAGFYAALSGHFLMMFIMPMFLFAAIYVNAGIVHLLLKIFRAGDSGFRATFRVCCYANATGLLYAVPFVGIPLSFLWQITVIVAGLKAVHRTSYFSVLLAYSPIILLGLLAFAAPFISPADMPPSM
ncbi:YIP1 family protein [Desulfovibrio ferrophilus]|uniref:MJ0042 family finger-like protein n=1 Tax=Desulfovibrio ferrophilus TaxID=241368 RepID=A0A2Z6AZE3_9BACT|nr:YIP1 family protein [Desulfovibrio ferrophilus]BBD08641.1 MJ0042 family finger-like protein [Desulfovibrio ferrophilus]